MNVIDKILISRGCVRESTVEDEFAPFYATKLYEKLGIIFDLPAKINADTVVMLSAFFGLEVPDSFYANPQDTAHFECGELLVEQLVAYFKKEHPELFNNDKEYARIPVFHKVLPQYGEGKEKVVRWFRVISADEAERVCRQAAKEYLVYSRPWSEVEEDEVFALYKKGYCNGVPSCKDNAGLMYFEFEDESMLKYFDYKDVVKLSVRRYYDSKVILITQKGKRLLKKAAEIAKPCPLTKKQAKYFNKIVKVTGADITKQDNSQSPYAISKRLVEKSRVTEAAEFLDKNGSLLERNLVWLLSRADENETEKILSLVDGNNPIILMQLLWMLASQKKGARVFSFVNNKMFKSHTETDEECNERRSVLDDSVCEKVIDSIRKALIKYYGERPIRGKVFLSDKFKKVFVPVNTSDSGKGIDVLPCGSRLPIKGENIRTFCYWEGIGDIDASAVFSDGNAKTEILNWQTYDMKPFGNSALVSGDDRGEDGAEYADFVIDELLKKGWKYCVYFLNGFESPLNKGTIYCGYQNKRDLRTKAWQPDNIQMKIHVKGNSWQYLGFAIDLENREIVVLNKMSGKRCNVVASSDIYAVQRYIDKRSLEAWNMYDLISARAELVDDPENADIVFDEFYSETDNKKVVRPWDVSTLISYLK